MSDYCLDLEAMKDFFPDEYPKGRSCNREYFFNVLSTLHPDYTDQLILKSKEKRFAVTDEG